MRICLSLLSPTLGMHEYTSDLANRRQAAGDDVHLVTTSLAPRHLYRAGVSIHMPVRLSNTGFSLEGVLRLSGLRTVARAIRRLDPDLVHFTGPHLWNLLLVDLLHASGLRVVHTLHDLHPHLGAVYGRLLYLWNSRVQRHADHILVHGMCFRAELLGRSVPASRVTSVPLTFPFVSSWADRYQGAAPAPVEYQGFALFAGRLARYKGLGVLVQAAALARVQVCIAGHGSSRHQLPAVLPHNLQLRNWFIDDAEAADLFRRCGVVVLPYLEASQSALVSAAYFFQKPVIVTSAGALPEYVVEGETGWVVPPGDVSALACALQEALRDPARLATWGQAGRAWWERQRSAEEKALDDMYRAVSS